jgi:hypothetical protein
MANWKKFKKSAGQSTTYAPDILPAYMTGKEASTLIVPGSADARVQLTKAARVSMQKRPNLGGRQFAFYVVVDMSGSMSYYLPSDVDYLVEATLTVIDENGWDADNTVMCLAYANRASSVLEVQLGKHRNVVRDLQNLQRKESIGGGTAYAAGVQAVMTHYRQSPDYGRVPAVVVFQSDGQDPNKAETARLLTECSSEPVFWVLTYYGSVDRDAKDGQPPNDEAASMRELDLGVTMPGRATDNVGLFIAGPEPRRVTPEELYDGVLSGVSDWVDQAPRDGVRLP